MTQNPPKAIMWAPRDFSYRKFRRKWEQDGLGRALRSSGEFATRKLLAPPVLHVLIEKGVVNTLDRNDLFSLSDRVYASRLETELQSPAALNGTEFVADVNGGYVLPSTGLATDSAGRLIRETVEPPSKEVEPPSKENDFVIETLVWHGFYESSRLTSALVRGDTSILDAYAKSIDVACPLCPRFTNYYHWMKETVPKLRYIREYESTSDIDVTYLVPSDAPPWLDETLELLSVPDDKVERAKAPVYRINRFLIPSFPKLKKQNYRWIRNDILENASPDREKIGVGNNVYISRANAIERQVVNEREVIETLSRYGFRAYRLENHSLTENAVLFDEADIVVGAHGAGLTDIIFCTDTKVVELFGSKIKDPYRRLAETLGLEYKSLKCEPRSTDLEIDTVRLEEFLGTVGTNFC